MRRATALLGFTLGVASAAYNPMGKYMSCADDKTPPPLTALPTEITKTPWTEVDGNGIPMYPINKVLQYHPVHALSIGIQDWAEYAAWGNKGRLAEAIKIADWAVKYQNPETGGFEYPFAYKVNGTNTVYQPGWISSMGQGYAMSFLARMGKLVGGEQGDRYLKAAALALKPLTVDVPKGGVRAKLNGGTWFEEYPTAPANYTLNGFIFTLYGLYDLAELTGSSQARSLYEAGRKTLRENIQLWDAPATKQTYYHIAYTTDKTLKPYYATPGTTGYMGTHARQLAFLSCIKQDDVFDQWAAKWDSYAKADDARLTEEKKAKEQAAPAQQKP